MTATGLGLALGLFLAMVGCVEVGIRAGRRTRTRASPASAPTSSVTEAAVLGLLGLLLAFAFARSAGRLDQRRQFVVAEANAIGTAYLRLALLPLEEQPPLRELFRTYLEARISASRDPEGVVAETARLQSEIWARAIAAVRKTEWTPAALLLLPAINAMLDVTNNREVTARTHVPGLILFLLTVAALVSALLGGHGMGAGGGRVPLLSLVFACLIATTFYVVLALDHPRSGLLEVADASLLELRGLMK